MTENLTISMSESYIGENGEIHSSASRPAMLETLRRCRNFEKVNLDGVNHVCVLQPNNLIFQASGYTYDRGAFCDLYKVEI